MTASRLSSFTLSSICPSISAAGVSSINTEKTLMSGDFVKVKITGSYEYDLIGEICDEFTE